MFTSNHHLQPPMQPAASLQLLLMCFTDFSSDSSIHVLSSFLPFGEEPFVMSGASRHEIFTQLPGLLPLESRSARDCGVVACCRFQSEVDVGMVGINVPIPVPLP